MIRPYQPDDVEQVLEVWFAAASLAHPFLTPEFMAEERETIRSVYMPITQTWVYEQAGRVVGFISLLENEVGAIFVDPTFQGRGVGVDGSGAVPASGAGVRSVCGQPPGASLL